MEIPQSCSITPEGRTAAHDFLSLYTQSTLQQDPRPPPSQGNCLRTHDFLGKTSAKEESEIEISAIEEPSHQAAGQTGEHILPGGIGTYSISHIPYVNQNIPKPEIPMFPTAQASSTERNDENSNCSSYNGSGFTLWEEPAFRKGKTGKENASAGGVLSITREGTQANLGRWSTEKPRESSSINQDRSHPYSLSSHSSSQPSGKSQSFMEMIISARGNSHGEESDDGEEFAPKRESPVLVTSLKEELMVKVDEKSHDQKANTPRSKHSATEQRRRSKINDRFQKLRELIPYNDQKRDKASFLLEVIEYIQFLQERVQKYEGSYPGWNHKAENMLQWGKNQRSQERCVEQSQGVISCSAPALTFTTNLNEKNDSVSGAIPEHAREQVGCTTTSKATDYHSVPTSETTAFPMLLRQHTFAAIRSCAVPQPSPRLPSNAADNTASQPQAHIKSCILESSCTSDELKEQKLAVDGGSISISSVYSQGLLKNLTEALQSSGVDLSQANISVQVQLGKKANARQNEPPCTIKNNESISRTQGTCKRYTGCGGGGDQPLKKFRTCPS